MYQGDSYLLRSTDVERSFQQSFFPEKPSTESKGENPSCFEPQVQVDLRLAVTKIKHPQKTL
jgi:hypothetical protein